MVETTEFAVGEKAKWIVGWLSDMDNCEIVSKNPDGSYAVRFQVYGSGPWHQGVAYPNSTKMGGLFKGTIQFNTLGAI